MKSPFTSCTCTFLLSIIIATMFTQYYPLRSVSSFQPNSISIAASTRRIRTTICNSSILCRNLYNNNHQTRQPQPQSHWQQQQQTRQRQRNRRLYGTSSTLLHSTSTGTNTNTNISNSNDYQQHQNQISKFDVQYMNKALDAAQMGVGNTYPNPAVGCVLVQSLNNDDNDIDNKGDHENQQVVIGSGFHPKAGYPHAEIFALFEACGYVPSGIEAAKTVVRQTSSSSTPSDGANEKSEAATMNTIDDLLRTYSSSTEENPSSGAETLFQNAFRDKNVTAYVTLEPCCHYGQTPPCALTFVKAGVNRVVVGYLDPNPRVDGGGMALLESEGIPVDLMSVVDNDESRQKSAADCANIVSAFAKRITPRNDDNGGADIINYDATMNGAKRLVLRNLAGRMKREGTMTEFEWPRYSQSIDLNEAVRGDDDDDDVFDPLQSAIDSLVIDHGWLERVDGSLWEKELILLRLNNAVAKERGAKLLGQRVAKDLNAHVAQVVGHTVLLYRPGLPPVLDLDKLIEEKIN